MCLNFDYESKCIGEWMTYLCHVYGDKQRDILFDKIAQSVDAYIRENCYMCGNVVVCVREKERVPMLPMQYMIKISNA